MSPLLDNRIGGNTNVFPTLISSHVYPDIENLEILFHTCADTSILLS